jgi:hydroxymethylpyrimidine pyrophosphatase-like HAD family hydrolase
VGNAVPALKAAADYQASTVDRDAVAEVIERFLL